MERDKTISDINKHGSIKKKVMPLYKMVNLIKKKIMDLEGES